jgi:hypothetical protein
MSGSRCALTAMLLALIAACTRHAAPDAPAAAQIPYAPKASIRELMNAEVDPAADALWDSVVQTVTVAGETDRQPQTAVQWEAVRRSALTLVEATNLLIMEGRPIAPATLRPENWELSPAVAQRRLETRRAEFTGFALALRRVSLEALAAIDARDAPQLFEAGTHLEEACEACHLVYWYPPDASSRH